MAKPTAVGWISLQSKRLLLLLLVVFSVSTVVALFVRNINEACETRRDAAVSSSYGGGRVQLSPPPVVAAGEGLKSPLGFMRSKFVVLVSHELSLSGTSRYLICFFGFCCDPKLP